MLECFHGLMALFPESMDNLELFPPQWKSTIISVASNVLRILWEEQWLRRISHNAEVRNKTLDSITFNVASIASLLRRQGNLRWSSSPTLYNRFILKKPHSAEATNLTVYALFDCWFFRRTHGENDFMRAIIISFYLASEDESRIHAMIVERQLVETFLHRITDTLHSGLGTNPDGDVLGGIYRLLSVAGEKDVIRHSSGWAAVTLRTATLAALKRFLCQGSSLPTREVDLAILGLKLNLYAHGLLPYLEPILTSFVSKVSARLSGLASYKHYLGRSGHIRVCYHHGLLTSEDSAASQG